jgi:hypothetical protein
MNTIELDLMCDTCGRPVENGDGALYVRLADIRDYQWARKEWESTRSVDGLLDMPTLLMMPRSIPWLIHHNACASSDEDVYDICVEQVRTWRDLVKWTSHLMSKNWLASTTWGALLGDAAEGRSGRIAERARNDAA